jgi:hypothetical protein
MTSSHREIHMEKTLMFWYITFYAFKNFFLFNECQTIINDEIR